MKLLKKVIFIGALILSIISTGISQSINVKIKGGLTYSGGDAEMSNDGMFLRDLDVKPLFAYYIGGVATFNTKVSKLKFQTELYYQLNKSLFNSEECPHSISFHQITLPVLAKYQLVKNLNLTGGAYLSTNLKVVETYNRNEYTKTDFGALFGLEYKLPNGILLDARFNFGLKNMILDDPSSRTRISSYYNRTLNVGIVYPL